MKIYIIRSVGSGKTTLARQSLLNIPHFKSDNFVWQRQSGEDFRNAEPVRDAQFLAAIGQSNWIIEDVHIGWTERAVQDADCVVFMDVPYHTRTFRLLSRHDKQKTGRERSTHRPSLSMLRKMYGWNRYFEKIMKPAFCSSWEWSRKKRLFLQTTNKQKN
ncbi:DNA topology modulation protein FlaR [Planococcus sp. ISL-110]|uniref:DNA topology modulation protein FlaR n=1 Tax=Planococcus sp. ISL-110 TaxID=2819167 RepID=UPI001BE9C22F|nr:DNA topology modulation protein FlaR [Planococcus sp. ISL-110]MBT2570803.1 DNA topology modulation protein FlaR [Planococcus sp. ISL-110]